LTKNGAVVAIPVHPNRSVRQRLRAGDVAVVEHDRKGQTCDPSWLPQLDGCNNDLLRRRIVADQDLPRVSFRVRV
jgi:hypothetical protein